MVGDAIKYLMTLLCKCQHLYQLYNINFLIYTYKGVGENLTDPSVIKAEEKR